MDSKPAGSGRSSETAWNATSPRWATPASAAFRLRETFQSVAASRKIPQMPAKTTIPTTTLRLEIVRMSTVITILERTKNSKRF